MEEMKAYFKYLIILALFAIGCSKKSEDTVVVQTGVSLVAIGAIKFGNVNVGEYKEAIVRVTNHGPEVATFDQSTILAPFSIPKITEPCSSGTIPVNATCNITVRFTPVARGSFNTVIVVGDKTQESTGYGLDAAGVIDYSVSTWDLGSVVSGAESSREISLTNNGDYTVMAPSFNPLAGYSRSFNECGSSIASKRTCLMRFTIVKTAIGTATDSLQFVSANATPHTVLVYSNTIPGPPSGIISLINAPSSIVANNVDTKQIEIAPIRDQYGNVVSAGTSVVISVTNLEIVGSNTRLTNNAGVFDSPFTVKSTSVRGDSTVSLASGTASGFLRFRALSGPAVGTVTAQEYINSVTANGVSQIEVRLHPLRDAFNNVVEDGTEVHFELTGGGTLFSSVGYTILGETRATIIAPQTSGPTTLVVKAGTNNGAAPCGWSACGSFPITFTPGLPSGTIPVVTSRTGIFSDPATGFGSGEIIQSTITIGPVRDQFNNIVKECTPINISLEKAIGVNSGTNSFTVNTDCSIPSSGMASFDIQGIGQRGYIRVNVAKETAAGQVSLWGYSNTVLRPVNPALSTNAFKLFMTYSDIGSIPAPASSWGLIRTWSNLDVQDKNYFGDLKKQAPPTLIYDQAPYFVSKCLFSSGNTVYGAGCFNNNFSDSSVYENTLLIVKANSSGDPSTSRVDLTLNQPRGSNNHRADYPGCYKMDTTPGSPTLGNLLYYNTTQALCSTTTSADPQSPFYNNDSRPWYGGTWYPSYKLDIQYSTVGFIPDFARVLTFGGYVINAIGAVGLGQVNHFTTLLTNLHTWASNFGISTPFNWKEADNVDDIYGDFPTARAMPSMASTNQTLFMFGGLELRGNSHTSTGANPNYVQSSANDEFSMYSAVQNKWTSLNPSPDPLITGEDESGSPVGRYQHGMIHIPDNNLLFLAGGRGQDFENPLSWFEPNDMWSVDISNMNSLQWKRRCSPCNFPTNAHFHPTNLRPDTLSPTPLKMTYNSYLQKVFMLWSGTNFAVSSFDPTVTSNTIPVSNTNSYSFSTLQGTDLFDMEFNPSTGRTYFYKRKDLNQFNSEIYYWDMDAGMKQYLRVQADLGGAPARDFVRRITVSIRGYGSVKDSAQATQGIGGIEARIYNYDTNTWDLINSNTASIESQDVVAQRITATFSVNPAIYVNANGLVDVVIYPRDPSGYTGTGYNELRVDEFVVDGVF